MLRDPPRSPAVQPSPETSPAPSPETAAPVDFAALGLSYPLQRAADQIGWTRPTPVQAATIPPVLRGRDLFVRAPTGSGKTGAYLLPLLQQLLSEPALQTHRPRRLRALVIAPTRELAQQIGQQARTLVPVLKSLVVVGGLSINPQMMALRGGVHLLVATPGRLLDLLQHHALHLRDLRHLVLDEADRLLDLGFADEVERLLHAMPHAAPRSHQTLMFSATLPTAVEGLAARMLHDPLSLVVEAAAAGEEGAGGAAPHIRQRAIVVDAARRTPLLRHLLASEGWTRTLVFVATQYASEHVADKLRQAGVPAAALHGQLSTGRRAEVLADLHQGRLAVLVATDLAARGLHVDGLSAVVQHDLPRAAADHVHRIGRTGRAGAEGTAVAFICADVPGQESHFRLIEKRQQRRVAREVLAGYEPAPRDAADGVSETTGGIKGRRKSKKDKLREAAAGQG
jgi:ATP-dependent RNA helicase RhlE